MQDQPCYPSDLDNTISVVATNSKDELASFSCYGMAKDFAAPGESTLTTSIKDGTKFQSGTSFSSPAVAAVVAMMCSLDNTLNFESVYNILATTSVDIGLGNKCKYGLIDAYAAVKNVVEGEADVEATTELEIATDVEATTDVETLTVEAKTPETTVSETTILNPVPLEVIGALVSSPAENTVAVVWGQDTERIENKYKYNVYVNGEKKLSLVDCSYYIISDIEPGSVAVRITAVFNEAETAGVTQTVTVEGSELNPSEATTEVATVVLETTTLEEITIEEVATIAITEETTVNEDIIIEEATEETTTTQEVINLSKGKATYASSVENDSLQQALQQMVIYQQDGHQHSQTWNGFMWI